MTASWIDKLKPLRTDFKPIAGEAAVDAAEKAMDAMRGLSADRKHLTRGQRRTLKDLRQAQDAAAHLERLPERDEAFHCVIKATMRCGTWCPPRWHSPHR